LKYLKNKEKQKPEIIAPVSEPAKSVSATATAQIPKEEYTHQNFKNHTAVGSSYEKPKKDSKDDVMNDFVLLEIEDEKITEEDLEFVLV
jgi:hypothetical protein